MVALHDQGSGDLQLQGIINSFLQEHDKPDSLIIIYYSGHGSHHTKSEELILHP
jgi:hypothetical protein